MITLARLSLLLFLLLPCLLGATPQTQSFRVAPSYFPNKGQVADKSVTWYSRGANVSLYLRGTTLTYVLHHRLKAASDDFMKRPHEMDETASIVDKVDVELVGANPRYEVQAEAKQAGVFHFYLPQCSPGLRDVPHYGRVVCRDVWPGVDLVLGTQGEALKYDFVVKPGADAGQIRLRYGGQCPHLTPDGGLSRPTAAGDLRESAPTAWTTTPDDSRKPVAAAWQLAEDGQPRFELGAYDATQPLTIDPVVWGMYLGGSGNEGWGPDCGLALCPASDGGVFMGGYTWSDDFDGLKGSYKGGEGDGFIASFSAEGGFIWGSYMGGRGGEAVNSLCSATDGGVFAGGWTEAEDFEGLRGGYNGGRSDGFLVRLTTVGDLVWGKYLGGTGSDGINTLCSAPNNSVFAGGRTTSENYEGFSGNFKGVSDGFLAHFSSVGELVWGSYLGGAGSDEVNALSPARDGGVFAGGTTQSNDFEGLSGGLKGESDGFLTHFSSAGEMAWASYIGGSSSDQVMALCSAADGGVFAGGTTQSNDFEGLSDGFKGWNDGFVMCFSNSGDLMWGSLLGGSNFDEVSTLCPTPDGGVFAGGTTRSNDFEGLSGFYEDGGGDGFIARFSAGGELIWGNYLGGNSTDYINALCPAPDGGVFAVGETYSEDFEWLSGGFKGGSSDCFLFKHTGATARPAPQAPLPLSLSPNPSADQAHLSLNLETGGPATLEAYDTAGRLVHSRRLALQAGDNRIDLDLSDWPAGVYSVHLKTEGKEYAGRLVKN